MKKIEILETVRDADTWQTRTATWDDICQGVNRPVLRLIFTSLAPLATAPDALRIRIAKEFRVPPFLFSRVCLESNGFAGCEPSLDDEGNHIHHTHWARFIVKQIQDRLNPKRSFIRHQPTQDLNPQQVPSRSLSIPIHGPRSIRNGWEWYEMSFFVHWTPTHTTILCFDFPPHLKTSIQLTLTARQEVLPQSDPYAIIATALLPDLVSLYDNSVWSIRNHICEWEATRKEEPDYGLLHEIARHAIHVSETLSVASASARSLQQQLEDFRATQRRGDGPQRSHHNPFSFQVRLLEGLFARSESNKARLQNETMLASLKFLIWQHGAFHTAAQRDSKTQVQIGEEAKKETAAMKAIAVITMTFLPATFISSVFSTPFFFFEPGHESGDGLTVSSQFWIYCAFAIPISLLTWGLWTFWDVSSKKKQSRALRGH
ncbi:hypothetical protein B0T16DRAFT_457954 [Cercophora newfieldiana]|uniref:Uncharacterized protein n=1 Tax=Cercophora newfieldiana TaxID=92897 RepID=A0AA39Y4N7_9PEZI|nr:hypothetical protein B0T16DRAFT_457954 [Cercophora newfieldiana]